MSISSEYEAVPYSVVSNLMNNLTLLSSNDDLGKRHGVAEQLQNLKSKVEEIYSKLVDVDRQQEEKDVRGWLRKHKSSILAADDLLDEIAMKLIPNSELNTGRRVRQILSYLTVGHKIDLDEFRDELKETQESVDSMVKDMHQLKLKSSQGRESVLSVTPTPSNRSDVGVVGRDNEKKMIIEPAKKMESDGGKHLLSTLRISYDNLPFKLKECFIYCCVYPKGWTIEKNELIQSWMAQGYLYCSNDEQQMEDLGNEFVNILLTMSFFVGKELDEYGNLVSLEMPDLIHDLACNVAGTDFYLDHSPKGIEPVHVSLSMESYNDINLSDTDSSRVRTFFLQQANVWEIAQNDIKLSVILKCKHLRLLNLSRTSLAVLPDSIGKLKSLRHLNLSWCLNLTSLPESIGKLFMLQTLKLTGCERLEFSTQVVTRLINLRHLEIHRCKAFEDMMPAELRKLTSLQSLSYFNVVKDEKKIAGNLNELQKLNGLRGNLEINGLDQVRNVTKESQHVNLKDKKLLESLELNWENQENIEDSLQLLENLCPHEHLKRLHVRWYPGKEFSDWLSSINNLSHISFFGFNNCKSLPPLENLPFLKSLEIGSMKVLEYINFKVVSSTEFFKSLARLKLSGCENFKGWKWMECQEVSPSLPQFHCLSQLIINKCPKLTDLPTFPNVEEMQLCESMMTPLKETLAVASSSPSSTSLSMLKSLKIEGKLPDISVLPSRWKKNLTSLEHLEIGDVDNLDIWFEDTFSSLKKVVIYGCDLKALPSKMCDMLSLQHIKMMGCHKLASLPKEMVKLTNLGTLEIWDCPLLVERCQSETGVDWPQISHVKNRIMRQNLRR